MSGLLDGIAHPRLCGEMEHHVGQEVRNNPVQLGLVLQHGLYGGEPCLPSENGMAPPLQLDVAIGRHAVVAENLKAYPQQLT